MLLLKMAMKLVSDVHGTYKHSDSEESKRAEQVHTYIRVSYVQRYMFFGHHRETKLTKIFFMAL